MGDPEPVGNDFALEGGSVRIANEVLAGIAAMAASEVDGVAELAAGGPLGSLGDRVRHPNARGVRVESNEDECHVEITISVKYGKAIPEVAMAVQENVRRQLESMTGLHVAAVDVRVADIAFS
ncbi:MAG: Asp23/Gls24 family envelope stress response protein [Firmicutes bacterium]|nr:Asp23/Gls24 family envelope stress response protein [Bacillota bacterium]